MQRIALTTAGLLALAVPTTANAANIVAGWDSWGNGSDPVAASFTDDVSASAAVGGGQTLTFSDGRGGSSDGTYGALAGPPSASTTVGVDGVALAFANGNSGFADITLTNNGSLGLDMSEFVFDTYARRPNAARTYELSIAAGGGLSEGVVFTSASQAVTHTSGSLSTTVHDEIGIDLSSLADATLGVGESVTFELNFTGGSVGSGGHDLYIDNLAVTANPVPEPTSLALLSLGSLLVARRRRG